MFTKAKLFHYLQAFIYALMFLTRLPVGRFLHKPNAAVVNSAVYFYPLVGIVLGLLLAGFAWLVSGLGVWLAAALTVALWVVLTGALHLDGLADCMDAYYAGHKISDTTQRRERILQVMHDPACGAVALVALVLVLLVKVIALASLWLQGASIIWLVLVPLLARLAILPFMALADYARPVESHPHDQAATATISTAKSKLSNNATGLWLAAFLYAALAAIFLTPNAALVLFVSLAALLVYWWRFWFHQIGGYTGDCLGALVELGELLVLILLVALC